MVRICVENAVRRIKILRISKEGYRNKRGRYGQIIHDAVCGAISRAILLKRAGVL